MGRFKKIADVEAELAAAHKRTGELEVSNKSYERDDQAIRSLLTKILIGYSEQVSNSNNKVFFLNTHFEKDNPVACFSWL